MSRESGFAVSKHTFEQYGVCEGVVRYRTFELYPHFAHRASIMSTRNGEECGATLEIRDGTLNLTGVRQGDVIEVAGDYLGPEHLRRRKYRRYLLVVDIDARCLVVELYRNPKRAFNAARSFREAA